MAFAGADITPDLLTVYAIADAFPVGKIFPQSVNACIADRRQFFSADIPWAPVEGRELILFHAIKK